MRRRGFFLLEVLIAYLIVPVLVAGCLGFFVMVWHASSDRQKAVRIEGERWQARTRLRSIIGRISTDKKYPFFFEEASGDRSSRLIFVFNNEVVPDPQLSNEVLGMLYLDKEKGLVLVTRSSPDRADIPQEREEVSVIFPNVDLVEWSFLPSQGDENNKVDVIDKGVFLHEWKQEWNLVPSVIQVDIREKGQEEPFRLTFLTVQQASTLSLNKKKGT